MHADEHHILQFQRFDELRVPDERLILHLRKRSRNQFHIGLTMIMTSRNATSCATARYVSELIVPQIAIVMPDAVIDNVTARWLISLILSVNRSVVRHRLLIDTTSISPLMAIANRLESLKFTRYPLLDSEINASPFPLSPSPVRDLDSHTSLADHRCRDELSPCTRVAVCRRS